MENPFKKVSQFLGVKDDKEEQEKQARLNKLRQKIEEARTRQAELEATRKKQAQAEEDKAETDAVIEAPKLKERADFSSAIMSAAVQLTEGNYKSYVGNLSKECMEKLKSTARDKKEADPQFFPTESWTSNCVRTEIAREINKYLADNPSSIPLLYDELRGLKDQEKIRNILTAKLKGVYATFISKKNILAKKYEEPKRREIP